MATKLIAQRINTIIYRTESMKALCIALISIMLNFQPAFAMSGNEFLQYNNHDRLYFVMGFMSGMNLVYTIYGQNPIPDGVTNGQLVDIITKYVYSNPEKRHLPMEVLGVSAIGDVYPMSRIGNIPKK